MQKVLSNVCFLFEFDFVFVEAIFHGKTLKETMNEQNYDQYKQTMSIYLAPDSFSQRGRFCCAHCELIFSDQWSLEKVSDSSMNFFFLLDKVNVSIRRIFSPFGH